MIRQLVEKTMKGPRFHPEMREAFFGGLGMKPPEFEERIDDVRVRGDGLDRFRVVLDLTRTRRGTQDAVRTLVPTKGFDTQLEAYMMASWMKEPDNLDRANQVLERSGNIRDQLLVATAASGAFAVGMVLPVPIF
ncbi:MAG TPA: hypothetical protein VFW77_00270 [Candidatus Saccharimonadales bacterium]|nr:hypothetical protein [Candidatus Saccharimonadales bacterium]